MLNGLITYRTNLAGSLAILWFSVGIVWATPDQELISLTAQSLGSGLANTAPSSAYNSNTNQYLVVFAKTDAGCDKERLFGIILDAITGEAIGSEFPISDCSKSFESISLGFSVEKNEYFIGYNKIESGAKILFQVIDANTLNSSPTLELKSVGLGDPFGKISISENQFSNTYVISYHEEITSSDNKIFINYIDRNSKTIKSQTTSITKANSPNSNDGVSNCQILSLNENIFACFELKLHSGIEVWGSLINPTNGKIINDIFQISPTPGADTIIVNPSAAINPFTQEILIAYERSHIQIATAKLNTKIRGILINGITGNLKGSEKMLSNIPPTGENYEDAKQPLVSYSRFSNEFLIAFYGRWWVNSSNNKYHNYLQRIDNDDLSLIGNSILVSSEIGSVIEQNNSLKLLGFSYNLLNNQFLISWMNESTLALTSQVWRYDNNRPDNLDISTHTQNENLPSGSTFARLSAEDPDPEDTTISYRLVSGDGDSDNNYFHVEGDKLIVNISPNYEEKQTLSIRARATDTNGDFCDNNFTLNINDIPESPKDILLEQQLSIVENTLDFSSTISAVDDDFNDSHTFALVDGDSSDNNANFRIVGNTLSLINPINFEDSSLAFVRIKATDALQNSKQKAFAIAVSDVNEPVDTIYLSPGKIPENKTDAFVYIIVEDPDKNSSYTISLTEGEGDQDNTAFTIVDNKLIPNDAFDFEEKNSYNVRLLVREGEYTDTAQVIVHVEDVNDPPENILLTSNQILDGSGSGFVVGKFITEDQDANDVHDYSLTVGGDLFRIDQDDSLITKIQLVYNYNNPAANFYHISVVSDDGHGGLKEQSFTAEVVLSLDHEQPGFEGLDLNPQALISNGGDITLSITATDNYQLDTVYFYYRKIRSVSDYTIWPDVIHKRNGEKSTYFEANIQENMLDELGLEYFFKIVDAAGNIAETPIKYLYIDYLSKTFKPTTFTYSGNSESYRLIANPYELGNNSPRAIFSDYGESNGKNWRLYKFENNASIEIGNKNNESIKSGHGYWFNKTSDLKDPIVLEKPEPLEYNRTQEATISLKRGWNLIGNPYPFAIEWDDVLAYNGNPESITEIYNYLSGFIDSKMLNEFEGGFIHSDTDLDLTIPIFTNLAGNRIASSEETPYEWSVDFQLSNGTLNHRVSGIGMHPEASESYDQYDTPLLPRFGAYADIAFEHPEHSIQYFAKDITSTQSNYIWEFVASTESSNKSFTLEWTPPPLPDNDKKLVLYDINNDYIIDMSLVHKYEIQLGQPAPFKAIYGDRQFVEEIISNIDIKAMRPYPNPFQDEVIIPLSLPLSKLNYEVTCNIFNLMGDKIFNRSENVSHGIYNIAWVDSEFLDKGIYIYSIKVKNKFSTREFHGRLVKD